MSHARVSISLAMIMVKFRKLTSQMCGFKNRSTILLDVKIYDPGGEEIGYEYE